MSIPHEQETISMIHVITGATGDVGLRVVELLVARGVRPRIFVRNRDKARARFGDRAEVSTGDLADEAALLAALQGADSLFLLNSGPAIPSLDALAARAARASGARHIVKLSSLDVEQSLAIGAWHEQGEAAIRASRIGFAFVRPAGFMSNLLAWAHSVKAEGVVRAATGDGRRAFIHSADIAAVGVEALVNAKYLGKELPITGPEAVSFAGGAEKIGAAIGRAGRFEG